MQNIHGSEPKNPYFERASNRSLFPETIIAYSKAWVLRDCQSIFKRPSSSSDTPLGQDLLEMPSKKLFRGSQQGQEVGGMAVQENSSLSQDENQVRKDFQEGLTFRANGFKNGTCRFSLRVFHPCYIFLLFQLVFKGTNPV